jgi:hypothetical protein
MKYQQKQKENNSLLGPPIHVPSNNQHDTPVRTATRKEKHQKIGIF